MAKRKRLAPAQTSVTATPTGMLETKSMPGLSSHPAPPPIAHVAGEASAAAALEELSETLRRARSEGRMVAMIALEQIEQGYLERDRIAVSDEDMEALKASIAARGQQTPIELVELGDNRFGLISGWRRLQALRALGMSEAKALITQPGDASEAYVAMIEENEIRVGLSYFERARLVLKSVEMGVFDSHKAALQTLFSSASRAKRSKIKSFIPVVQALGGALRFPAQMGERMGLSLSKALSEDSAAAKRFLSALTLAQADTAEAEQDALTKALSAKLDTKKRVPITRGVTSGVMVSVNAKGDAVTLKGKGVTSAFLADLEAWIKARG